MVPERSESKRQKDSRRQCSKREASRRRLGVGSYCARGVLCAEKQSCSRPYHAVERTIRAGGELLPHTTTRRHIFARSLYVPISFQGVYYYQLTACQSCLQRRCRSRLCSLRRNTITPRNIRRSSTAAQTRRVRHQILICGREGADARENAGCSAHRFILRPPQSGTWCFWSWSHIQEPRDRGSTHVADALVRGRRVLRRLSGHCLRDRQRDGWTSGEGVHERSGGVQEGIRSKFDIPRTIPGARVTRFFIRI